MAPGMYAYAADGAGTIHGLVTSNPNGMPVPGAVVSARSADPTADQTVFSDSMGNFVLANVKPGQYRLTVQKEGLASPYPTVVAVAADQGLVVDLALGQNMAAASANSPDGPTPASTTPAPVATSSPSTLNGNFFHRIYQAYVQDWTGTTPSGPEAPRRPGDYPAPVDGPPFPFSDWPMGGTVTIGAPWTQSGPLMQAIWSGKHGEGWKKSGVQIYGWFNGGCNWSTSRGSGYANLPTAYAEKPNTCEPDQEVVYIEKQPDTVQTDHFDWGFRLASLWGIDYRFTTAKGIFSQQLLGRVNANGSPGKIYGYDPVMFYADLYFPWVAQGMNVRIGRYISLPDIEAQLAPNNYTYTHSLTYTYDCYTQTGINTTTRINNHWTVQLGVSAGCEAAPWTKHDGKLTFNACATYTWNHGRDQMYPCLNAYNSGKYSYNNLQAIYNTWYHKFGNSSWHMATEYWYMWEKNVPNVNPAGAPDASAALLELNANGAWCRFPTEVTCYAPEHAVVNYVEKQFGKHDYLTIRNEWFDDQKGQRTGFKSQYTEHEISFGHWIGTTILMRPEVRWERSYDVPAYNNGTKKNQFMVAGDIIYFF